MPNTDFQNGVILGSVAGGNIQTSSPSGEISITENGEYDVAAYETATVNVSGGSPSHNYIIDTTPTEMSYFTADNEYYYYLNGNGLKGYEEGEKYKLTVVYEGQERASICTAEKIEDEGIVIIAMGFSFENALPSSIKPYSDMIYCYDGASLDPNEGFIIGDYNLIYLQYNLSTKAEEFLETVDRIYLEKVEEWCESCVKKIKNIFCFGTKANLTALINSEDTMKELERQLYNFKIRVK